MRRSGAAIDPAGDDKTSAHTRAQGEIQQPLRATRVGLMLGDRGDVRVDVEAHGAPKALGQHVAEGHAAPAGLMQG